MSAFFEIAYAAASRRLCLFTGSGFSKAITENNALGREELLEKSCSSLANTKAMRTALFPKNKSKPMPLEDIAQVLNLELAKTGKNIHDEVAKRISKIKLSGDNSVIEKLFNENAICIVTMVYDKLVEALTDKRKYHSITPGLPIPGATSKSPIYHIHGSIDSPANMALTSDDCTNYLKYEFYFSQKIEEIFQEKTIVFLGYSLTDINLKKIINQHQEFSKKRSNYGNIFLVIRSAVSRRVKDYYAHFYGIKVIDQMEIHTFFEKVEEQMDEARKFSFSSIENLKNVLSQGHFFDDQYLKINTSFFEIITTLTVIGRKTNEPMAVAMLGNIIQKKIQLTRQDDGWEQHVQLARWLCLIASILDFRELPTRNVFLNAALHSMNSMSRDYSHGHSWLVHRVWSNSWPCLLTQNKKILRNHIRDKSKRPDALSLVGWIK